MIQFLISTIMVLGGAIAYYLYVMQHGNAPTPARTPEDTPNGAQTAPSQTQNTQSNQQTQTSKLKEWALAAQNFEGWYPGSTSYRHCNPGNCKDLQGEFIQFKTYQDGFDYLCNYFIRAATGQHRAYPKGGETTLNEFYHIYTSDPEPSPTNYAIAVAKACSVTPETKIKDLIA